MKWTLIVLGLLMTTLIGLVIAGVGKHAKPATSGNVSPETASATQPASVPFGRTASVRGGWTLRIISVDWNAAARVAAVPGQYGQTPPAQAQEVMLLAAVAFKGGGSGNVGFDFGGRVFAIGSHNAPYKWTSGLNACAPGESKLPPPDAISPAVEQDHAVFSGTTLRGHMCFEVAKNDVRSLRLYVTAHESMSGKPSVFDPNEPRPVYFALR